MFKKNNSIKSKIFLTTLYILIIQQIIFFVCLNQTHIFQKLNNNSFTDFSNNVNDDSLYLEGQMNKYWGDIFSNKENIENSINTVLQNNNLTWNDIENNDELLNDILKNVCPEMVFILKKNHISGSFLILNTYSASDGPICKKGIYIKDIAPDSNINTNSDLLLCIGNKNLATNNKLVFSPSCEDFFTFDSSKDYNYQELFENIHNSFLENKTLNNQSLCYWSCNVSINNSASKSITCSLPLVDSENNILGILGVEISEDYLIDFMKKYDSNNNKFDALLLAARTDSDLEKISILENNKNFDINTIKLSKEIYPNIYKIENSNLSNAYACVYNISNINTQNNNWVLIGINDKNKILSDSNQLIKYLLFSFIFSLVIAVIICYINGKIITKPILQLLSKVKNSDPEGPIKLDKINISEIDELSNEIMNLSSRVFDNASKLSQILQMVNVPIGAFEYIFGQDTVFCTEGFFINMGIDEQCSSKTIPISQFREIISNLIANLDIDIPNDDDIYKLTINGEEKFVQLTLRSDKYKVLGVLTDETHAILERKKIEYERDYDLLTNLLNRMSFRKLVEKILRTENIKCGAIVTINLDNLKSLNTNYSYEVGDEYIKLAAEVLSKYLTPKTIICRRSADEFIVFTYEYNTKAELLTFIHDMHIKLKSAKMNIPDGSRRKIRSTFGISWYPNDSTEYHELCRYSEFTTFRLKKTSKGTVGSFNKEEYNKVYFLLNKNEDLNKLIEEELLQYAFHPIVDVKTGKIFAYEALMRSKLESIKSPLEILQLATSESKLYEIERLTIFKSLEFYHKNKDLFDDAKLFINSIPNYILSEKDSCLLESMYSEDLHNVVIELLEHEQAEDLSNNEKIKKIRKWNAQLAIDDFGSGYNNESVLLAVTPDFVKIDMEIVQGVERDKNREHIIRNLISYCKDRNIKVIAEGIETLTQLEKLMELGIDYGQGYYFSKPEFSPPKLNEETLNELLNLNKK